MPQRPDITPNATDELPGLDLFMTVVKVSDWAATLAWYVEVLGLLPVLTDVDRRFALLAAGTGRMAIQGDPEAGQRRHHEDVRLVFNVPDVNAEMLRLLERGVAVSEPIENPGEGYREVRLRDPDGTHLTLFSWTRPAPGSQLDHPPESG